MYLCFYVSLVGNHMHPKVQFSATVYLPGFFPAYLHLTTPEFILLNPTLKLNLHPMFGDPTVLLTTISRRAYRVKVLD
jgi:hypothetical protein